MENNSYPLSSLLYSLESVRITSVVVVVNFGLLMGLLMGYAGLGLGIYIHAFTSQRHRLHIFKEAICLSLTCKQGNLRGVQHIHNGLLTLIFMDVVNTITAIVFSIQLAKFCNPEFGCVNSFLGWLLSRNLGLYLHFLNALVCLRFLHNPQRGPRLHSVQISVVVMIVAYIIFFVFVSNWATIILSIFPIGMFFAIIAVGMMPTASPSAAAPKRAIMLVSTLTFFIVYGPSFVLQWLAFTPQNIANYMNVLCGTHFLSFVNGLLCYFILKLPSEEEERQQELQRQQESFASSNNVNSSTHPPGFVPTVDSPSVAPGGPQGDPRTVEIGDSFSGVSV